MKKWFTLLTVPALCAVGLTAWAVQDDAKRAEERVKVEREIRELEAQRQKIDSRIRELRRQSGRSEDVRPKIRVGEDIEKLSPEDREKVERALAQAHKAVEEATKNLPDFKLMIPDMSKLHEKIMKLHMDKDGKFFHGEMTPEQREQFKKEMSKMRDELRKIGPEIRAKMMKEGAFKDHMKELHKLKELKELKGIKEKELRGPGELKSPDREDIRKVLEEARREMEQAREEMRRAREEMLKELREERARSREREKKPESEDTRPNLDSV